jgi:hypothetical protein
MKHIKLFEWFITEIPVIEPGSIVYHTSPREFTSWIDRPTWFTADLDEARAYHYNTTEYLGYPKAYTYKCEIKSGKYCPFDKIEEYSSQVWPDTRVIYSMFDKRVREFEEEDVDRFITILKEAGYNGAIHSDYSSQDQQKNSYTLVVFEPNKRIEILERLDNI